MIVLIKAHHVREEALMWNRSVGVKGISDGTIKQPLVQ